MASIVSTRFGLAKELLKLNYPKEQPITSITSARETAKERFEELGVPLERDEYWKFSSPNRFTSIAAMGGQGVEKVETIEKGNGDEIQVFFKDGILDYNLSNLNLGYPEIEIIGLNDVSSSSVPWVEKLYGELEAGSHQQLRRPLAAYNTACASDGIFIRVKKITKKQIVINYIGEIANSESLIHNLIKLEPNTNLTLIEKGEGACRSNRTTEVDLLGNSQLNHVRFFGKNVRSDVLNQIFVRQASHSTYNEFSLIINNEFIRNEFHVALEGQHAKVSLSGANLGKGNNIQDDTIFIAHKKPDCESRQVFKKVLQENATGIFQGKIFVTADAQKTDGYQISKGLLIGSESKFLTKPELEIYADDVICSHGSTCGAIDEESLFYLSSRGVSKAEAVGMLILAFLDEAVQEIKNETLAAEVRSILWEEMELNSDK